MDKPFLGIISNLSEPSQEIENKHSSQLSIHFNTLSLFSFYGWKEKEISVLMACLILRQGITAEKVFQELVELQPNLIIKSLKVRNYLKIRKVLNNLEEKGYLVKGGDQWFIRNQNHASAELFENSKYIYWQTNNFRAHNHSFAKLTFNKQDVIERKTKSIRDMFLIEMISLHHENHYSSWQKIKEKFNVSRYEINKIETAIKTPVKLRHCYQEKNAIKYSTTPLSFDVGLKISQKGSHSCGYHIPKKLAKRLRIPQTAISSERGQSGNFRSSNVLGIYDFLDSGSDSFLLKRSNDTFDYKIKRCLDKWHMAHNGKNGKFNHDYVKSDEHFSDMRHVRNTLSLRSHYSKNHDRYRTKAIAPVYRSPKVDVFTGY